MNAHLQFKYMNKLFLPTSRKVLSTFQTYCPVGVSFCLDGIRFILPTFKGKGVFGVGLGVFCVRIYPQKGSVKAE